MQTIMVIWGFMGPLFVIGLIGIIYGLHNNKKHQGDF
jgi:hypothetical protein